MEFELHTGKAEPDYRWTQVQSLGAGHLGRFISYRDDVTFAWFSVSRGGGVRLTPTLGSAITEHVQLAHIAAPVLEIRQYRIRPGLRARFAEFFATRALPAQLRYDIPVYGQFEDLDDANNYVFLRGFADLRARDCLKAAFYQSKLWLEELQDDAFSMIEDYSNVVLVAPVA